MFKKIRNTKIFLPSLKLVNYVLKSKKNKWSSLKKKRQESSNLLFKVSHFFKQDSVNFLNQNLTQTSLIQSLVDVCFAPNLKVARKLVFSKKIKLNGNVVNCPSIVLKKGDCVQLIDRSLCMQLKKTVFYKKNINVKLLSKIPFNFEVSYSTLSYIYT